MSLTWIYVASVVKKCIEEYNFIYTLKGKNKEDTKLYWTCARKKTCKARVHTVSGQVVFRSSDHTHAPDTVEAAARSVVTRMVASVTTVHESTRNVIRGAVQGASESTHAAILAEGRCPVEFNELVVD